MYDMGQSVCHMMDTDSLNAHLTFHRFLSDKGNQKRFTASGQLGDGPSQPLEIQQEEFERHSKA